MFINSHVSAICDGAVDILSQLSIRALGIVVFGSSLSADLWRRGQSDIDLNVFVTQEWHEHTRMLANILKQELTKTNNLRWKSLPHSLVDSLQPRVEAVFTLEDLEIDVTWATATIRINRTGPAVLDDQLEVYLGQIYQYGQLVSGRRVPCVPLGDVLPYYKDERLWQSRLETTRRAFAVVSQQALAEAFNGNFTASRHSFFVARRYFWQALCQQRRRYPLSNEQHIEYQLQILYGLDLTFDSDSLVLPNIIKDAIQELEELLRVNLPAKGSEV